MHSFRSKSGSRDRGRRSRCLYREKAPRALSPWHGSEKVSNSENRFEVLAIHSQFLPQLPNVPHPTCGCAPLFGQPPANSGIPGAPLTLGCYRGSNPIQPKPYGVVSGIISILSGFCLRGVRRRNPNLGERRPVIKPFSRPAQHTDRLLTGSVGARFSSQSVRSFSLPRCRRVEQP